MVAYSFQRQFRGPILARTKQQTIRATGKRRHARAGDGLQLYIGMRTKHCALVGRAICLSTEPVTLEIAVGIISLPEQGRRIIFVDGLNEFAVADGFQDWPDMAAFWRKHHPGIDTCWTQFEQAGAA
jgi:hypothetical protein